MKFGKLLKLILEETDFSKLPENPPYGFWVSPSGEFFPVRFEAHNDIASKIIKQRLLDSYQKHEGFRVRPVPSTFLISKNYVRVVIHGKKLYTDTVIYPDMMRSDSKPKSYPMTPKAKATIVDMAIMYDCDIQW